MTWLRVETTAPTSDVVGELAERLEIDPIQAWGHYSACILQFGDHCVDGNAASISDTSLEQWAGWRGERGRFAHAFRARCVDDAGIVRGWWRQEKLLARQLRDRTKRSRGRKTPVADTPHPENPQHFVGGNMGTNRGKSAPRNPQQNAEKKCATERNDTLPSSTSSARASDPLWLGRFTATDRAAINVFLDSVPDAERFGWTARLRGYLDGLDMPSGLAASPAAIATAIRDYPTGEPLNPARFRKFIARAMRDALPPSSIGQNPQQNVGGNMGKIAPILAEKIAVTERFAARVDQ